MGPVLNDDSGMPPIAAEVDIEKFKDRYDLSDEDFDAYNMNGELWIRLQDGITLADDPPIFEPPDP